MIWTWRLLAGRIGATLAGSLAARLAAAVAMLGIARQLGAEQYGVYAACSVVVGLFSTGYHLGLDTWLLRAGGANPKAMSESFGAVLVIRTIGGLAWLPVVWTIALLANLQTFPVDVIIWSAVATYFDVLFISALTAFRASLQNHIAALVETAMEITWLTTVAVLGVGGLDSAIVFVQVRTVLMLLCGAIAVWLAASLVGATVRRETIRRALSQAFPFAASDLLAWCSMRLDVLIVALIIGTSAVGVYSPAVSLLNATFLLPAAFFSVMLPTLSNTFATDEVRTWRLFRMLAVVLLAAGGAAAAALALASGPLALALGDAYAEVGNLVRLLSVIVLLKSGSFAAAALLIARGRQRLRPVVQAVIVLISAGANVFAARHIGIYGVAAVYVCAEVFTVLGYSWLAFKRR
jgi:O-antigen/teichoic acid export membrane protein